MLTYKQIIKFSQTVETKNKQKPKKKKNNNKKSVKLMDAP
jgi:hypothetical protein